MTVTEPVEISAAVKILELIEALTPDPLMRYDAFQPDTLLTLYPLVASSTAKSPAIVHVGNVSVKDDALWAKIALPRSVGAVGVLLLWAIENVA